MSGKFRIQVDATTDEMETLDGLKAPLGVRTRTAVVLKAVRLLRSVTRSEREGWVLRAVKKGETPVEPVL